MLFIFISILELIIIFSNFHEMSHQFFFEFDAYQAQIRYRR